MNNKLKKKALGILGPTAAGKTQTAVSLAQLFSGEVVSCDSVQIYKRLNIGSAKPAPEEIKNIPYHLIDIFDPDFQIDAGIYKKMAEEAILNIIDSGKLPIITGGTGMYFNSLYYGFFEGPGRDNEFRKELEKRASLEGLGSLYAEMKKNDAEYSVKVQPNDKRRIIRALEVYHKTGIPFSKIRSCNQKLDLEWFIIGLECDRKILYEKIEERVDQMVQSGLVEETEGIIKDFGAGAFALGCIGYRHALNYIEGKWNFEQFVYNLKLDTRHYAKRQMTWFKKIKEIHWHRIEDWEEIVKAVKLFLSE